MSAIGHCADLSEESFTAFCSSVRRMWERPYTNIIYPFRPAPVPRDGMPLDELCQYLEDRARVTQDEIHACACARARQVLGDEAVGTA